MAIVVAAILFVVIIVGMRNDVDEAIHGGRSAEVQDSRNTAWMIEGLAAAAFLVAGIAMVNTKGAVQQV